MDLEQQTSRDAATKTPGQGSSTEVEQLSNLAVMLSNRDYLLNEYCLQQGVNHSDIFAKARAYSAVEKRLREFGVVQFGVPIESKPGPTVTMEFFGEKRTMIMFASNDYLNLSTDPRVHDAIRRTLDEYGVGAGKFTGRHWLFLFT